MCLLPIYYVLMKIYYNTKRYNSTQYNYLTDYHRIATMATLAVRGVKNRPDSLTIDPRVRRHEHHSRVERGAVHMS